MEVQQQKPFQCECVKSNQSGDLLPTPIPRPSPMQHVRHRLHIFKLSTIAKLNKERNKKK